jgi:predicted SAM-dependent methyltransferase
MRLHIGGDVRKDGWTVLNVQPGPHVDIVGSCTDLSMIADGVAEDVYASHVLEHLSYTQELPKALAEIFRVLQPGGRFYAAVPDFELLCRLFLHPQAQPNDRWEIMRRIFGGQGDPFDFHKVGLWADCLAGLLRGTGFGDLRSVESFGLFDDGSKATYGGVPVSLNLEARKPAA